MFNHLGVISLLVGLFAASSVKAQGARASSTLDYAPRAQYRSQAQQPRPSPPAYTPALYPTTVSLPSGTGSSPDMAGYHRQASQQSRQAANHTKCPENKRYYTAIPQYCDGLADQFRTGSTATCPQHTGQAIQCPQDT